MNATDKQKVWYVSYGSNLSEQRFKFYVEGGYCPLNNSTYDGCTDQTMPEKTIRVILPYYVYFARESGSWNRSGVAFLDYESNGISVGRAWLVTEEQFDEIHEQEGTGWYDKIIDLGLIDGIPAKTFTSRKRYPDNPPSEKYFDVIKEGFEETCQLEFKDFG